MRIASGVTASTTTRESANALATSASAGNLEPLLATGGVASGVRDHVVDRLVERPARLPRSERLDPAGVWLAAPQLLESLPVRGLVRDQPNARAAARALDHPGRELDDRDLERRADVEYVTDGLVGVEQQGQRVHRVGDVHEAARLGAAPVDGEVLARKGLLHEARQHHPVGALLTRADGVEEAGDHDLRVAVPHVAMRERLAEGLRGGVAPARLERGAEHAIGLLVEGTARVLPVDLGCRGVEQPASVADGRRDHVVGAADVAEQRLERARHDELDPHGRGEVVAGVDGPHALVHHRLVEDAALLQLHVVGAQQMLDVGAIAGAQVIQDQDLVAARGQRLRRVGADEPGPAGDEISHAERVPRSGRNGALGVEVRSIASINTRVALKARTGRRTSRQAIPARTDLTIAAESAARQAQDRPAPWTPGPEGPGPAYGDRPCDPKGRAPRPLSGTRRSNVQLRAELALSDRWRWPCASSEASSDRAHRLRRC